MKRFLNFVQKPEHEQKSMLLLIAKRSIAFNHNHKVAQSLKQVCIKLCSIASKVALWTRETA